MVEVEQFNYDIKSKSFIKHIMSVNINISASYLLSPGVNHACKNFKLLYERFFMHYG